MPSSTATVRVPTASSSARSWEIEQQRAREALQRRLERLAALEVEVVGRLVEDEHVGAGVHEDRQRQPPALAAGQPVERLLGRLAAEQEAGRAARAPRSASAPSRAGTASSTRAGARRAPRRAGRAAPSLTLWPRRSLPPSSSRSPASARDQRRLARAVRARRATTCSPRSSHSSASSQQLALADPQRAVLELEDHAAGALGRLEREAERLAVARVALEPLDLVELLDARLRLARARAGAEAVDEALEPRDLGLLLLDRAAERELARGLLRAATRARCP